MEPNSWASLIDLALKAGVPTALGCAIIWYLLWHHIPKVISTFENTVADLAKRDQEQREDYRRSIATQAEASRELVTLLRASLTEEAEENRRQQAEEAARNRETIAVLAKQMQRLSESVHRLHGAVGVPTSPDDHSIDPAPDRAASPRSRRIAGGGG